MIPKRKIPFRQKDICQSLEAPLFLFFTLLPLLSSDIHMVKDGVPTDCELEGLSEELAEKWEALGRRLEFNQSAIANFDEANKGLAAKAFKMLLAWKQKEGSKATYTVLYDALCHKYVKCKRLAEQFCWKKL